MSIEVVPTGAPVGAEVRGVDWARDPDPEAMREIEAALSHHFLLIFRSQEIDKDRLVEVADLFGSCHRPGADEPGLGDASLHPVVTVSNVAEHGVLGCAPIASHSDQEYLPDPSQTTLLYAVEVPPEGRETSWSNLCDAYDDLSDRAKRRVESLERWCLNPYAAGGKARGVAGKNQRYFENPPDPVMHPLVRTDPHSGRTTTGA